MKIIRCALGFGLLINWLPLSAEEYNGSTINQLVTNFDGFSGLWDLAPLYYNSDDFPDLVALRGGNETGVYFYVGDGMGGFTLENQVSVSLKGTLPVAPVDFNNDGRIDIVTGRLGDAFGSGGDVVFLFNAGGGNFATTSRSVEFQPVDLAVEDIDGDGYPDIAFMDIGNIYLYFGNESGTIPEPIKVSLPRGGTKLYLEDFDSDGITDLGVFIGKAWNGEARFSGGISIIPGQPDRAFDSSSEVFINGWKSYVETFKIAGALPGIGDLNDDGVLDVVTVTSSQNTGHWLHIHLFKDMSLALDSESDATFEGSISRRIEVELPAVDDVVGIEDLDGDGLSDIIMTGPVVLWGIGKELWSAPDYFHSGIRDPFSARTFIADMDTNGLLDIVTYGEGGNGNFIFPDAGIILQNLPRIYNSPELMPEVAHQSIAPVTGDFDGNGMLDTLYVVDVEYGTFFRESILQTHLNVPQQSSSQMVETRSPQIKDALGLIREIQVRDFDNDGNADFFGWGFFQPSGWLFYGNGDGTFQDPEVVSLTDGSGSRSSTILFEDINGDELIDIISHNGNEEFFVTYGFSGRLFLTPKKLTFTEEVPGLFSPQFFLHYGDFDNDQIPDILGYDDRTFVLLKGTAETETFEPVEVLITVPNVGGIMGPYLTNFEDDPNSDVMFIGNEGAYVFQGVFGAGFESNPVVFDMNPFFRDEFEIARSNSWPPLVTDLNNDGLTDFTVLLTDQSTAQVYLSDGQGSFTFEGNIATGSVQALFPVALDGSAVPELFAKRSGALGILFETRFEEHPKPYLGLAGDFDLGVIRPDEEIMIPLTLENYGTDPLEVTGISLPDGLSGDWNGTLNPGESQLLNLVGTWDEPGAFNGILEVFSNAKGGYPQVEISAFVQSDSWWESFPVSLGTYKSTVTETEAGIGYIDDSAFPWIYSSSLGSGEWFYVYKEDSSRTDFYAYRPSIGTYLWISSTVGWYYQWGGNTGWNRF